MIKNEVSLLYEETEQKRIRFLIEKNILFM